MLLIKNAKIVVGEYLDSLSKEKKDLLLITDILVKNEKIIEIKKNIIIEEAEKESLTIVDAEERFVLPGIIDPHCHMRDPGFTSKEDFTTGSKGCIRGGVTTFIDMPNTSPLTTTKENLESKKENSLNRSTTAEEKGNLKIASSMLKSTGVAVSIVARV